MSPGGTTVFRKKEQPHTSHSLAAHSSVSTTTAATSTLGSPTVVSVPSRTNDVVVVSTSSSIPVSGGGSRVVLLYKEDDDDSVPPSLLGRQQRNNSFVNSNNNNSSWRRYHPPGQQQTLHSLESTASSLSNANSPNQRRSSSSATPSPDGGVPPSSSLTALHASNVPHVSSLLSLLGASASSHTTNTTPAPSGSSINAAAASPHPQRRRGWDRLCTVAQEDGLTTSDLRLVSYDTLLSMMTLYHIIEPDEVALIEAEWALFQQQQQGRGGVGSSSWAGLPPAAAIPAPTVATTSPVMVLGTHVSSSVPTAQNPGGQAAAAVNHVLPPQRSTSTRSVSFDRGATSSPNYFASAATTYHHHHATSSPTPTDAVAVPSQRITGTTALGRSSSDRASPSSQASTKVRSSSGGGPFFQGQPPPKNNLHNNNSAGISPMATSLQLTAATGVVAGPLHSPMSTALNLGDHSTNIGSYSLRASPIATNPPTGLSVSPSPLGEFSASLMPPKSGSVARALFVNAPQALRSYSQQSTATTAHFSGIGGGGGGGASHHTLPQSASWRSSASATSSFRHHEGFDTALAPHLQHKVRLGGHRKLLSPDVRKCTSDPNVPLHPEPWEHPTGLRSVDAVSGAKYVKSMESPPSGTKKFCDRRPSLAPRDNLFGGAHA
ncbi:Hypothetical protein, putative [Bodo saltans]|uniref:Uncharacterized protein n=1 Tax=Bodo saltans TaxID=75058 RepID=A0A0S4JAU8_BODSA|nr:Hypothetical protein, putative [Bodo saltans]|eukprot:CUG87065.1 Hypothetical protein, putative [Bodo saltans]